jgi:hypothetical protein
MSKPVARHVCNILALQDYITAGGKATYTMFVQLIPEEDVATLPYNIFDVTKVVPHGDYPLREVGKLVLNKMPDNFFEETEQVRHSLYPCAFIHFTRIMKCSQHSVQAILCLELNQVLIESSKVVSSPIQVCNNVLSCLSKGA